ncbi:platelet endothelial aggregation receptor 1 [Biomphalaria glabrata]|nr:platelet endothelial aggregation receptor 1 [Biomphalaria glabrata]
MALYDERTISVCLLCVLCIHMIASQDGWFGPNQEFKCHCESSCSSDGTCLGNGKCARGWFGLKCQHQDLILLDNTPISTNASILTDQDDRSCMDISGQTIVVTFNITYVFTWMRVALQDMAFLSGFTVQFSKTASMTPKIECANQKYFFVDNFTLDIECDQPDAIRTIIITGSRQTLLCSLYINGGRNVALKQMTWQTSTYTDVVLGVFNASKAVDGNTNSNFYTKSCTHTAVADSKPMWTVNFPLSEITRYVIYNRGDSNMDRLAKFVLTGENSGLQTFHYNDPSDLGLPVYIVIDAAKHSLTQVNINSTTQYLTLCEVEIYGECPAGSYTTSDLQCTNCPAACPNNCHRDGGSCSVCLGYSNPPACTVVCSTGRFGINCAQTCPSNCFGNICDPETGQCSKCKPGFYGGSCDKVCVESFWGQNCSQPCNPNCQARLCHNINGECIRGCVAGFMSPTCTQACPAGQWGVNCSNSCGVNCYGQSCDKTTGICDKGCQGFSDPPSCTTECAKGNWGPNCQFDCRNNCFNLSCDSQTGKCDSGCEGFMDAPDCTVECKTGKWGRNCVNQCSFQCKDQSCDRVTGLCDYTCDSLTNLSCPADCPKGYHGSNCTLDCSSTCKDLLCNRLGYCIACVSAYTGRYCEKVQLGLASETSGLTFSSGVGIGVAVGALVIILIDVVIVIICRTRLTTLRARSNDKLKPGTRLQNYDGVKQINEYNHSYEPSRSTFEEKGKSHKKQDGEANETIQYENTSNTVYETIG